MITQSEVATDWRADTPPATAKQREHLAQIAKSHHLTDEQRAQLALFMDAAEFTVGRAARMIDRIHQLIRAGEEREREAKKVAADQPQPEQQELGEAAEPELPVLDQIRTEVEAMLEDPAIAQRSRSIWLNFIDATPEIGRTVEMYLRVRDNLQRARASTE